MTEFFHADALEWLPEHPGCGAVVTSLPDAAEMGWPLDRWAAWFARALAACLEATSDGAPTIFFQTDRRADGRLHSKAVLVLSVAERLGRVPLWHKVALRRPVGSTDLFRPGYSHLIALGRPGTPPGTQTTDVLPPGRMLYENAMPLNAAVLAVRFAASGGFAVVDPFCGRGTVPAVAEALGIPAVGIDVDAAQLVHARALHLRAPSTAEVG